jgi:hypothetical protein
MNDESRKIAQARFEDQLAAFRVLYRTPVEREELLPGWMRDRQGMRRRMETARKELEAGRSPLMNVCSTWIDARLAGDPLPDWVLKYLDRAFADFWGALQKHHSDKRKNNPGKALAAAFGANNGRGKPTIWDDYSTNRYLFIGHSIMFAARQLSRQGKPFYESGLVYDVLERIEGGYGEMSEKPLWLAW